MSDSAPVPSYEPMLAAYHRAFAAELRAMVGFLPINEGQTVLDMACGDGVYSPSQIVSNALASTVFSVTTTVQDTSVPLTVTLTPGDYGVVFGVGPFGAGGART